MKSKTKNLALSGLLIALAFILSYIEGMFPIAPVYGMKVGLANLVTMLALYWLSVPAAFLILVSRCVLIALLFGGLNALAFSLTGGLLALFVMQLLKKNRFLSPFGVSMAGAAAHNIGQTSVAVLLMQSPNLYSLLMYLLPISIPTGLLIAFLYKLLQRTTSGFLKNMTKSL